MSRIEEGTTQITMTGARLEFQSSTKKIRIQRDHSNTEHGLRWYTVETFYPAGLVSWEQGSRMIMAETSYDFEYNWLTQETMGDGHLLNKEHVSFEAFVALCKALA